MPKDHSRLKTPSKHGIFLNRTLSLWILPNKSPGPTLNILKPRPREPLTIDKLGHGLGTICILENTAFLKKWDLGKAFVD
jgi:hypothetical protein